MADARRLTELGMVPVLAKELAAQITAGVGNFTRLAELSMVPRLAKEVAAQIATPSSASMTRLAEMGMVPGLASEIVAQIKGGGALRDIEVAGTDAVINGRFLVDIANFTDGSSAGGSISWVAPGRLRATNATGTARGRQNPIITAGAKYLFHAQGYDATANGSITVGSTLSGTEIFNQAVNSSILARWLERTFVAPSTQAYIGLLAGVAASSVDYDWISMRPLVASQFQAGRWFEINFNGVADGDDNLPDTPEGIPLRQINTTNGTQVPVKIEGGRLVAAVKNASGPSAAYPFIDFGNAIVTGVRCDISWTGATGPSVAMISMAKTGADATIANIVANSTHNVFTDTKVDVSRYVSSVSTVETVTYASPAVRDGRVYEGVGWTIDGPTMSLYCPNNEVITRSSSAFTPVLGGIGLAEPFYSAAFAGDVRIHKMRFRIG